MTTQLEFARDVVRAIHELEFACEMQCDWCHQAEEPNGLESMKAYQADDEHWYHEIGADERPVDCQAEDLHNVISDLKYAVVIAGYIDLFDNIWSTPEVMP